MEALINDCNINYEYFDNKSGISLVFLHGWGQNIEMMMPLAREFNKKYNVLVVDLPGYGLSAEPKNVWNVYEYALAIHELIKKLKIKKPIMLGHSFGGKITLVYASRYETSKVVVFGSPFKKGIEKLSLKTKTLKALKKIPLLKKFENFAKKHIGSTDYRSASPMMRKILVDTVNLDITEDVIKINVPTLIIWGENDEAVSINDAKELELLIPNAGLVVYPNATHYAYLECLGQTINVLNSFIESKE